MADVRTEGRMNGQIGEIAGMAILVSNNTPTNAAPAGAPNQQTRYRIVAGHAMATSFAQQLSEVEAYRPERRFADAPRTGVAPAGGTRASLARENRGRTYWPIQSDPLPTSLTTLVVRPASTSARTRPMEGLLRRPIVFVMVTGIAWAHLPRELGCSGTTAWRRQAGPSAGARSRCFNA